MAHQLSRSSATPPSAITLIIVRNALGCCVMQVRRKTIGGQAHYDIVEVFQRGSRT